MTRTAGVVELDIGSMEIFRDVSGKITEAWNCGYKQGVWS